MVRSACEYTANAYGLMPSFQERQTIATSLEKLCPHTVRSQLVKMLDRRFAYLRTLEHAKKEATGNVTAEDVTAFEDVEELLQTFEISFDQNDESEVADSSK